MRLQGRVIYEGSSEGTALVARTPMSFFGGVDPNSGTVVERGHELQGESVKGRVLVFPNGKGSTVGSYIMYRLKKNGCAPSAIINERCETIVAVGAIISEIPCVDGVEIERIKTGDHVKVQGPFVEI